MGARGGEEVGREGEQHHRNPWFRPTLRPSSGAVSTAKLVLNSAASSADSSQQDSRAALRLCSLKRQPDASKLPRNHASERCSQVQLA